MIGLEGHRTVLVGGAGAIGSAIAEAFAAAGASVTLLDLDLAAAEQLVAALAGPGRHRAGQVDVTDPAALEAAAERCGELDSVVYCAGIAFTAEVAVTDWAAYRRLMAVNLDGAFYAAAAFVRVLLAAARPASMVFLSSTAGVRGEAGASAYCASKFGLRGLVESLAAELTPYELRVNAVAPGNVDSPLLASVAAAQAAREGGSPAELLERYAHAGAARRLVRTSEVAASVLWLASGASAAVTGELVRVDAGQMVG